jgi:hypothetical protein
MRSSIYAKSENNCAKNACGDVSILMNLELLFVFLEFEVWLEGLKLKVGR